MYFVIKIVVLIAAWCRARQIGSMQNLAERRSTGRGLGRQRNVVHEPDDPENATSGRWKHLATSCLFLDFKH